MENFDSYFITQKNIKEFLNEDDFVIVFDTNTLLAAYQWRSITKQSIEDLLELFD
ncbi:hypothetical protein K4Q48_09320 [Staphylococcus epidermidis]|nr:hypothetical protein [Staphylococcus epidermidis]MCG1795070.1 hypothetical protein [Staphylococcus epidermidis]MCG2299945.1 hypothetical protein [Staphylococcus epidermidis]